MAHPSEHLSLKEEPKSSGCLTCLFQGQEKNETSRSGPPIQVENFEAVWILTNRPHLWGPTGFPHWNARVTNTADLDKKKGLGIIVHLWGPPILL